MKAKTHSGAKKRFKVTSSGKVKRGQAGLRHLLENKRSKRKRHLGDKVYVDDANMKQIKRMMNF